MNVLAPVLGACLFVVGCGGGVAVEPAAGAFGGGGRGAGGAGGAGVGGGGSGDVGVGGGDGATCDALVADLAAKIAAARACSEVGTWDECDYSATVEDECGCHAPLNHLEAAAVSAALEAADAVIAAGCGRVCDFQTCVARYNDPAIRGGCIAGEGPSAGVCAWTGAS